MLRSMTAYARREKECQWGTAAWELRSVNHRYLDITLRLPEELRHLEPRVRRRVADRLRRGKVECQLRLQLASDVAALSLNIDLVKNLAHLSRQVDEQVFSSSPVSSMDVLRWPGVIQTPPAAVDDMEPDVLACLDEALDELVATRDREGRRTEELLVERLEAMSPHVTLVRQRMPQVIAETRTRLRSRLEELQGELDQQRLEQEIVYFANRIDVAEELDRLDTHMDEVRRVITTGGEAGRRLDFLMQELNREANTLASKSAASDTTQAAVEIKVLIEQMREQVQNVE
ncbi:MAG: YicC/YloC family endoribonuclease [Gammaproteobacteria bacterium]|nr:YicC/YloC family endoribonuclease [Gammaproteobacteria bacterium]